MLPRGRSSDWAHDGGIYRPVRLLVTPKVFIESVAVDAEPDLSAGTASIAVSVVVRNTSQRAWNGRVGYRVTDEASGNRGPRGSRKRRRRNWPRAKPGPSRCGRRLSASRGSGTSIIPTSTASPPNWGRVTRWTPTFGIRKIEIRDSAFYLNGERVRLMGVERMAGSNPEYGMAEPVDWIEHDHADMKELNCVYTRVHWPQDRAVLDWCDRHGMFIQTEVPDLGQRHVPRDDRRALGGHHEQRPGTTAGDDRPRPQPSRAFSPGACATRSAARIPRRMRSPGACTRKPRGSIPSGWSPTPPTRCSRRRGRTSPA